MKNALLLCAILLAACGPSQAQVETAIAQTLAAAVTDTPAATSTPESTSTPEASNTPRPTNTPRPSNTPAPPTETRTPIPPVLLSGQGDSVVEIEPVAGAARLARINYTGGGNFIVYNYDESGNQIDLLVNKIGAYTGTLLIDLVNDAPTARFEIQSSGSWTIEVVPISDVRREVVPGTFSGTGDDVIFTDGPTDLMVVDGSQAASNLIIYSYGSRQELLVNEIAPYIGTVVMPNDTLLVAIRAEGAWTIEVK